MPEAIAIDLIRIDGGTQIRVEFDETASDEYAEHLMNGGELPPVDVFFDGADYWLANGFHRLRAHRRAWREEISAEVRQGSRRDAVLFAVGSNAAHGLRRSNGDKRNAVETLLKDPEWAAWPLTKIAETCRVSVGFVHKLASFHGEKIKSAERTVTRGGVTYTMNTANIGARPAPEFINNEATWRKPDAYRAPGEETAHPDYHQLDIEDFTAQSEAPTPLPFPPIPVGTRLAGAEISQALQTITSRIGKLTPAEVVEAATGELWTDAANAEKAIPWLTEFMRLVPDEMSRRERLKPYLKGYRRGASGY